MNKNEREIGVAETKQLLKQIMSQEFKDSFNEILNVPQEQFFENYIKRIEIVINDQFPSFDLSLLLNIDYFLEGMKMIVEDYYLPIKFLCNKTLNEYKAVRNPIRQKAFYLTRFTPHCFNNKTPTHTCQGMFVLVIDNDGNDMIVICEKCYSCYYVECIKMYCDDCDCEFLSCEVQDNESVFPPVTWSKYHCGVVLNQPMTCMTCNEFLVLRGNVIHCKKCKVENNAMDIEWKCVMCHKPFRSDAKIYNPLEFKEMKLAVKNALVNKLIIKPTKIPCGCDDNPLKLTYFHKENCKGVLLSGDISQKKIVVCSLCKVFCSLNKYKWLCPICHQPFKTIHTRVFKIEENKPQNTLFHKVINEKLALPGQKKPCQNVNKRKKVKAISTLVESSSNYFPYIKTECNNFKGDIDFNLISLCNSGNNNDNRYHGSKNQQDQKDEPKTPTKIERNKASEPKSPFTPITPSNKSKHLLSPQTKQKKGFFNQSSDSKFNDSNNFLIRKSMTTIKDKEKEEDLEEEDQIAEFNVEDYTIFSQLGQGTFGKIYLVEDKNKSLFSMKKLIISDKEHYLSLTREYDIYARYKHNHILSILGISKKKLDETTYSIYILMEVGITDWEKEIEQRKVRTHFYSEKELMAILRQLTSALVYLQRNNVSHRDIKAQNILVFKNRIFKIADFGEARKFEREDQKLLTLRGTELYMAPLLFNGLKTRTFDVNHNPFKSDVFSLGLCMVFGATLNIKSLCTFRELGDNGKVKMYINNLMNKKYSIEFINLITKMVSLHEDSRPDFIELEEELIHMNG